mgnify:CR=1 FL=1
MTVGLLPENMFGRYLQLAALSIYFSGRPSKLRAWYGQLNSGIQLTQGELVELVESVRDFLVLKYGLDKYDPCQLLDRMSRDAPRFYMPNDNKVLSGLLFPSFNIESCKVAQRKYYPEIAVSFIEEVRAKNGDIEVEVFKSIPMLFKSMIFSEEKVRGVPTVVAKDNVSLAIGVLGLMVSYAGRLRVGDKTLETYVLPDGSMDSLSSSLLVYTLLFKGGLEQFKSLSQRLVDLPGVSVERALLTATSIRLAMGGSAELAELTRSSLPEKFLIARISPEQRPNMTGINHLTSAYIAMPGGTKLLRVLDAVVGGAYGQRGGVREKVLSPLGECVNLVSESFLTGNKTHLVECARLMAPLYHVKDLPGELRDGVARLLNVLRDAYFER